MISARGILAITKPCPPRIIEIGELVVDEMRWLGLVHLIGIANVGCRNDPKPRSRRAKWLATPVRIDAEDSSPDEGEYSSQEHIVKGMLWQPTQGSMLDKASQQPYTPMIQRSDSPTRGRHLQGWETRLVVASSILQPIL